MVSKALFVSFLRTSKLWKSPQRDIILQVKSSRVVPDSGRAATHSCAQLLQGACSDCVLLA